MEMSCRLGFHNYFGLDLPYHMACKNCGKTEYVGT